MVPSAALATRDTFERSQMEFNTVTFMAVLAVILALTRGVSNRAKWCPRFQDLRDLRISMGFQYFIGISRSHMDFKISMRFHRISLRFCKIS